MSVELADLKFYKSATVNDTGANGGRLSTNVLVSGVSQNVFPVVNQDERAAGSTKWRKVFAKNEEGTNLAFLNAFAFIENFTPAADRVVLVPGTLLNTQAQLTGSERRYVCGALDSAATAAENTVVVQVEDEADDGFQVGDRIRIANKKTPDNVNGTEEEFTLDGVADVGVNLLQLTLNNPLANNYGTTGDASIDPTRVASMLPLNDLQAKLQAGSASVTSAGGSYDFNAFPLLLSNKATIQQTWTLNFTTTSAFNIVGDTLGTIGTGTVGGGAAPNHAAFGEPYFTLQAGGFSGAFTAGNSITFTTNPSAFGLWLARIVPAGMASFTANKFVLALAGESE